MKFHIDLARYRAILTGDRGYFPNAIMLVMESTRIVTTLVTIEMNES